MKKETKKTKTKVVKVEQKQESKRLLNDKAVAVTYMICAVLWLGSGILDIVAGGKKWIIDFVITALLILLGIVYFIKAKKSKN